MHKIKYTIEYYAYIVYHYAVLIMDWISCDACRRGMLIVLQTAGFHIIMEHCIRKDLDSYGKSKDFY